MSNKENLNQQEVYSNSEISASDSDSANSTANTSLDEEVAAVTNRITPHTPPEQRIVVNLAETEESQYQASVQ